MGLSAPRSKQRFGLDPRNTNWSNDTSRFGHQHLSKLGWTEGKGLGLVSHATTSHVKVVIKTDNAGLGSKLARKRKDGTDGIESDSTGLDVFQRLLGRLNGKEDEISSELDRQRNDRIINGKWGISFIKGDVLQSTWDAEKKALKERKENSKKRSRSDDDDDASDDDQSIALKKSKKDKKEKKAKKEKKVKKEKKEKREKKDKSEDKKEKKSKDKSSKSKKDKKEKKEKKDKSKSKDSTPPPVLASKMALRSKWIRQKRAAVMDEKALNEIFMIS